MFKRLFRVLLVSMCCVIPAQADFVPNATLYQIADKSDVLVAGEVLEVRPAVTNAKSTDSTSVFNAKIRVLRAYPAQTITSPTIEVQYRGFAASKVTDSRGRESFLTFTSFALAAPALGVGQHVVLPLDKSTQEGAPWPFSIAEGTNLLVPIALDAPLLQTPTSRLDFLQNELAGAISVGNAGELRRAVDYLFDVEFFSRGEAKNFLTDEILC